jgi:predicted nucleic acid-binding protein
VRIVVDSYAWVELFIGSNKGRIVKERLGEANEVYTPDIVLAELARKYRRERVEARIVETRLSKISELSRVIPVDKSIALKASELDSELREKAKADGLSEPSLFDAIILATTKILDANIVTGDEHFKGRPEVVWIGE